MILDQRRIRNFRRKIWRHHKRHRRDLPFRNTRDPYRITVSEIMLQQTQIARVVPKYEAWTARWPNWRSLARAGRKQLLRQWSGLGYNRRAIALGELARKVVDKHGGELPADDHELLTLPGIGPYTAQAILIFAFDQHLAAIDTNIRRVILHELDLPVSTTPKEIETIARRLVPRGGAREWHYALMDYSALALPRRLEKIPPASKQSPFAGSLRQIRGEIIRRLTTATSVHLSTVSRALNRNLADVRRAAESLARDDMIVLTKDTCRLKA